MLQADGFPAAALLEPCPHEERAKLGEAAGRLLPLGLDSGHWEIVQQAADALSVNDPEEP